MKDLTTTQVMQLLERFISAQDSAQKEVIKACSGVVEVESAFYLLSKLICATEKSNNNAS